MRVLFVQPPHCGFDRNASPRLTFELPRIPPISGIVLSAYLRQHGHQVALVDGYRTALRFGNVREPTYRDIQRQALSFSPDIVMATMLTSDFYECKATVESIREVLPGVTIIGGGPHASGEPVATLQQIPHLDALGLGPGEDICLDLANGRPVRDTPGCVYRDGAEIEFTERRVVDRDIDSIAHPAWDLIDLDFYTELNWATTFNTLSRSLGVLTSRGCPRSCTFCASRWNRPLRVHSAEYVLDLCQQMVDRYPIDTIAFWDDTFGIDRDRLLRFCEGFKSRGLHRRVRWRAHLRADEMTLDLLEVMKSANCYYVAFGAESGSDRILRVLNKHTTVEQNYRAAELIKQVGMMLGISVIIGAPTETRAEIESTIRFCKEVDPDSLGVGRFCPLPGSPSYASMKEEGLLDPHDVDWEELGDFSEIEGPCAADIDPAEFVRIGRNFQSYCESHNLRKFSERDRTEYPTIVALRERLSNVSQPSARKFFVSLIPPVLLDLLRPLYHRLSRWRGDGVLAPRMIHPDPQQRGETSYKTP